MLKIIAYGDSLVAGYGLAAEAAFPSVLQEKLRAEGYNVTVGNAGVSGDTTTAGLARFDWAIADGADGVILELGANDMLRGVDPEVTKSTLDTILAKLKSRNIKVLIAGMKGEPALELYDQLHPNPAGVERIVEGILPTVHSFLEQFGEKAAPKPEE